MSVTAIQRLLERIELDDNECWLWQGGVDRPGSYGRIKVGGKQLLAHRFSYESLVGPIPEGLEIDHLCRVRGCVNPDHLEPVTRRENQLRGDTISARNARAVACIHGHPFDEKNTYLRKDGRRQCRACRDVASRRALDRKRVSV